MKESNLEEFKKKLYNKFKGEIICISDEYFNNKTELLFKCTKCNAIISKAPNAALKCKSRTICKTCAKEYARLENIEKAKAEFVKQFKEKYPNNEVEIVDINQFQYMNESKYKMDFKCNKCRKIWNTTPYNTLRNSCSHCAGKSNINNFTKNVSLNENSKKEVIIQKEKKNNIDSEKEIIDFIKNDLKVEDISINDKTILTDTNDKIDIYIPSLKIAIIYNDLYYDTEQNGKGRNYHYNKMIECANKGIRTLNIYEDEWLFKTDIVKSKIKHILKKNNNPKIYARKCYIKEITDAKLKDSFLDANHIQGKDRAKVKLGLFTKDENKLVSIMTFCVPRLSLGQKKDSKKYDYELSRFASDINYNVIGAFSKLLKYFKDNYEWNKLITYADKRWSEGNVYLKNGWTHLHDSRPNYWYTKDSERFHRFIFRKTEVKRKFPDLYSDDLTEFQIMDMTEYRRIWDCGNFVFEYTK